jgi:surface antigen
LISSGSPAPLSGGDAFPTRRELRAREAAAASGAREADARPRVVKRSANPGPGPRRQRQNPLTIAVALAAIPGIFLTTALPAYAFSPSTEPGTVASASQALTKAAAQTLPVASGAATLTVAREGFTATTPEELDARNRAAEEAAAAQRAAEAQRAASAASVSSSAYAVRGARAEGDDYPWPYQLTDDQGGGLSPLSYYYRECVDFVAWRLNRDAGSTGAPWRWTWGNLTPGGGDASSWKSAWQAHGWTTSATPVVGAVAWFTYNHVAYVQSVPGDGTVVLEEYNWSGSHAYHTRVVPIGQVDRFLYPPA